MRLFPDLTGPVLLQGVLPLAHGVSARSGRPFNADPGDFVMSDMDSVMFGPTRFTHWLLVRYGSAVLCRSIRRGLGLPVYPVR